MDNQKSTEGKGSDASRDSAGSSIGKSQDSSLSKGSSGASGSSLGSGASGGSLGGSNASPGSASGATSTSTGAIGGTSNAGTGSSLGSSAAGSSGSMGASTGSSNMSSSGNSGLGASGSTTGSTIGSSGAMGGASTQTTGTEQQQGGIKGMMSSVTPDRMHQSIDKAAQAAQPMVERIVSSAHAGVDRVSGMLSSAQHTMGERSHQLSEKYTDLSAQGREYVRNNPGSALLAAIGVGFVLAKLLSGSSDRRESRSYRSDYRDY